MSDSFLIPKYATINFDLTHNSEGLSVPFLAESTGLRLPKEYDAIVRSIEASMNANSTHIKIAVSYEALNGVSEQRVKKVLAWLQGNGFLGEAKAGYKFGNTSELSEYRILKPFYQSKTKPKKKKQLVVVKDDGGKPIKYDGIKKLKMLTEYNKLTDQVARVNKWLSSHELMDSSGERLPTDLHRVFLYGGFSLGGRWYAGYQSYPSDERDLFTIDGCPVVQLDYQAMTVRIAYAVDARKHYDGDPYLLDGYDRSLVKTIFQRVYSTSDKNRLFNSLIKEGLIVDRQEVYAIIEALREKHYHLATGFFDSNRQIVYQNHDSMIIGNVLNIMMKHKIIGYPIHDAVLVKRSDEGLVRGIMQEEFSNYFKLPNTTNILG
jgi:hypothetical protein